MKKKKKKKKKKSPGGHILPQGCDEQPLTTLSLS